MIISNKINVIIICSLNSNEQPPLLLIYRIPDFYILRNTKGKQLHENIKYIF